MFSSLRRLVRTLRRQDPSDPPEATDGGETGRFLHRCPGCGEVYLSDAPRACSACDRLTEPLNGEESD